MKIQSATMQLSAQHLSVSQHQVSRKVSLNSESLAPLPDRVSLSTTGPQQSVRCCPSDEAKQNQISDPKVRLIADLVSALTGKKIRIEELNEFLNQLQGDASSPIIPTTANVARPDAVIEREEFVYQQEQTQFNAQGTVKTADGKEIQFELNLTMSREFLQVSHSELRMGPEKQQKDPLVINFSGNAAQLSNSHFLFDIDSDGTQDNMPTFSSNSGFLVFDRNKNGVVDDGSELFGAQSGNGFADLAAYDEDKNGWIDENDTIFSQLQTWQPDQQGKANLNSLKAHNIGALYLGQASTPFSLNDRQNTSLGLVRQTGIYLNESGQAGTIQQIDVLV